MRASLASLDQPNREQRALAGAPIAGHDVVDELAPQVRSAGPLDQEKGREGDDVDHFLAVDVEGLDHRQPYHPIAVALILVEADVFASVGIGVPAALDAGAEGANLVARLGPHPFVAQFHAAGITIPCLAADRRRSATLYLSTRPLAALRKVEQLVVPREA